MRSVITIHFRPTIAAMLFLSAALLLGSFAHADPSVAEKRTADTLVLEGRSLLKSGDARGALEKFNAAHAIMHTPTTALEVATALEALGQLVEARAMVDLIRQLPVEPGDPPSFRHARDASIVAIAALDSRIPSILLHIEGPAKAAVLVTVDGVRVPDESLMDRLPLNPGQHHIVATALGYQTARATVDLVEGAKEPVRVPLVLGREVVAAESVPPASAPAQATPPSGRDNLIFAGIAVSVTSGIVAVATGMGAIVEDHRGHEENRVLMGNTAVWTAIGAGVLGGGTLVYALATRTPSDKPSKAALWVAPTVGGVVLGGSF